MTILDVSFDQNHDGSQTPVETGAAAPRICVSPIEPIDARATPLTDRFAP